LSYRVKEIFYSLQGEGFHSGRPSVFCRFAGCNLWSGREADRDKSICKICDTDFLGTDGPEGGKYATAEELAKTAAGLWPEKKNKLARPFVICTGGEPLLQMDAKLTEAFHREGFKIAIETNGTVMPPAGIDWLCVSPKAGAELIVLSGQELKLVLPQQGIDPEKYTLLDFQYFFLQPLDGPELEKNTRLVVEYVLSHPQWRLSSQIHKSLGIR
jgi:7-carboxy-7-deazaguanine synthase (Cx14CxxC type)